MTFFIHKDLTEAPTVLQFFFKFKEILSDSKVILQLTRLEHSLPPKTSNFWPKVGSFWVYQNNLENADFLSEIASFGGKECSNRVNCKITFEADKISLNLKKHWDTVSASVKFLCIKNVTFYWRDSWLIIPLVISSIPWLIQ